MRTDAAALASRKLELARSECVLEALDRDIPGGDMSGSGMKGAIVNTTDAAQSGQAPLPASVRSAARIDEYFRPFEIAGVIVVFAFRPLE